MSDYIGPERRANNERCIMHENKIERIQEKVDHIYDDIKEVKVILKGNGKIGIAGKVQILWTTGAIVAVTVLGLVVKAVWCLL